MPPASAAAAAAAARMAKDGGGKNGVAGAGSKADAKGNSHNMQRMLSVQVNADSL